MRGFEGHQTVIFHHIPKTAGVTFGRIGGRQYAKDSTFPVVGDKKAAIERFKSLSRGRRRNYRFIYGHQAAKLIDEVEFPVLVTMFREPVARVLSLYYYARRKPRHPLHDVSSRYAVEKFFELGMDRKWPEFTDGQFSSIACIMESKSLGGFSKRRSAERLKDILKKQVVFGLLEQFDESLLLIKETLGWKKPVYYKRMNTNPAPREKPYPQWVVEHIRDCNKNDIELYEFAEKEFTRRVGSKDPGFASQLKRFRRRNRALGPLYAHIDWFTRRLTGVRGQSG